MKNNITAGQYDNFSRLRLPDSEFKFILGKYEISFPKAGHGLIKFQKLPNNAVAIVSPIHQMIQVVNGKRFCIGSLLPLNPIQIRIIITVNDRKLSHETVFI